VTDWDHNRWYHRLLLREIPPGAERVLDVGCGAGTLARVLASRVPHVDAVDRSAAMLDAARRDAPANLTLYQADALTAELPASAYDAVVSSAVLHHLPLGDALPRMAALLRPGGVLAAVALPRIDPPRDVPVELAASLTHHGLGLVFTGLRQITGRPFFEHEPSVAVMPMADAVLTTRQVRAEAEAALPGARVRRLLLWRYLLTWRKPLE
jgi:SAM-dependent methyltransferase